METKVYLDYVENGLKECCDRFFYDNSCVAKAAEYSLLNGGKRTRAIFVFLTRDMCGADWKKSLYRACGVEMIHCYSLIHDDLPCMDNDDVRTSRQREVLEGLRLRNRNACGGCACRLWS